MDDLCQKVWNGERITQPEAVELSRLPLQQLGALSDRRRELAKADDYDGQGNEIVTYILDRNINYTNVCNVYCKFCAFWRTEKQEGAYVISHKEIDKKN
jgi:cyclic dehypoxanthinyl futalosine synthase